MCIRDRNVASYVTIEEGVAYDRASGEEKETILNEKVKELSLIHI